MENPKTITDLNDLSNIKLDNEFAKTFIHNIEFIFGQPQLRNVRTLIFNRKVPVLINIRAKLRSEAAKLSIKPRPLNDKKKDFRKATICDDIILLGPCSFLASESIITDANTGIAAPPAGTDIAASQLQGEVPPVATDIAASQPQVGVPPVVTNIAASQPQDEAPPVVTNIAASQPQDEVPPVVTNIAASGGTQCVDPNIKDNINKQKIFKLEIEVASLKSLLAQSAEDYKEIIIRLVKVEEWTNVSTMAGLDLGDILSKGTANEALSSSAATPPIVTLSETASEKQPSTTIAPPLITQPEATTQKSVAVPPLSLPPPPAILPTPLPTSNVQPSSPQVQTAASLSDDGPLPEHTPATTQKSVVVPPLSHPPPPAILSMPPPTSNGQSSSPQGHTAASQSDDGPLPEITKKTDIFIGNVTTSYNCEQIKNFINKKTGANLVLSDIEERFTRASGKAFRVSTPTIVKDEMLKIWRPEIKAEIFIKNKTVGTQNKGGNMSSGGNKNTFRNPYPQSYNWRGPQAYGQNRQFSPSNGRNWQDNNFGWSRQAPNQGWGSQDTQNRSPPSYTNSYQYNRWAPPQANWGGHYQQGIRNQSQQFNM